MTMSYVNLPSLKLLKQVSELKASLKNVIHVIKCRYIKWEKPRLPKEQQHIHLYS